MSTARVCLAGLLSSRICAASSGRESNPAPRHSYLPRRFLGGVPLLQFQSKGSRCQSLLGRGGYDAPNGRRWKLQTFVRDATVKVVELDAGPLLPSTLKEFLEDLKSVGRVRLIVNTGVAVLESVTSFEKLFYHAGPRGEYANLMNKEDNVDFHLLLEKVALGRLVKGKSMRGDIPTYTVRLVDTNDTVAVSVLVMWKPGTDGDYDPGQVEAFQALLDKYGEEVKFIP